MNYCGKLNELIARIPGENTWYDKVENDKLKEELREHLVRCEICSENQTELKERIANLINHAHTCPNCDELVWWNGESQIQRDADDISKSFITVCSICAGKRLDTEKLIEAFAKKGWPEDYLRTLAQSIEIHNQKFSYSN